MSKHHPERESKRGETLSISCILYLTTPGYLYQHWSLRLSSLYKLLVQYTPTATKYLSIPIHLHTLPPQHLPRQQRRRNHTPQAHPTRQIQHIIDPTPPFPTRIQPLRNKRTHNAKQSAPKTRNTARRTSYRCRKSFRRPSIQYRVEHGLEKVLHDVESDVRCGAVDAAEQEDGRDAVGSGAEEHADDAG
jgi:hypothetical protein